MKIRGYIFDTGKMFYDDLKIQKSEYKYNYINDKECDLDKKEVENMDKKLVELKHWLIDRSFKNKFVRKFYKWLENKYNVI